MGAVNITAVASAVIPDDRAVPLPSAVYSSTKLSLILSPPVRRSSPVPSLAVLQSPSA